MQLAGAPASRADNRVARPAVEIAGLLRTYLLHPKMIVVSIGWLLIESVGFRKHIRDGVGPFSGVFVQALLTIQLPCHCPHISLVCADWPP
jgi:hypothetical protein